jgi:hypothetical protein
VKISDCDTCHDTHGLCLDHQATTARLLTGGTNSLLNLYVELNLGLIPGRAGSDEPIVSMSRGKRLPLNAAARDAQERIVTTVLDVEAWVRLECGYDPAPRRGREGPTLQAACQLLAANLDQWARREGATTQAARLLALGGPARTALGIAGPRHNRIDLPCPACNTRALRRLNGHDDIACAYCATVVPREWLERQLDMTPDHDQREAA